MALKLLPVVVAAASLAGVAEAKSVSFSATFAGDRLTEIYTEEGTVCPSDDASCYPTDFSVPATLRSAVAPFAGLAIGTELPFNVELQEFGEAVCSIGGFFECFNSPGYDETEGEGGEIVSLDVFDFFGDYAFRADFDQSGSGGGSGEVSFFGAAGSLSPNGCSSDEDVVDALPGEFCDFYGYEAEFVISSEEISVVPLNASMLFALFGLGAFAGIRGIRRS